MVGLEFTIIDSIALILILVFAFCKAKYYLHNLRYIFFFLGIVTLFTSVTAQVLLYFQLLPLQFWGECSRETHGVLIVWTRQGYAIQNLTEKPQKVDVEAGQTAFSTARLEPGAFVRINHRNLQDFSHRLVRLTVDSATAELSFATCLCPGCRQPETDAQPHKLAER